METRPSSRTGAWRTTDMTVGQVMSRDMLCCPPDTSIADAAERMNQARSSSIMVADGNHIAGIWTEHDALRHDLSRPEAYDTPISSVMTAPVATIEMNTSLGEAALRLKQQRYRHYLVIDSEGNPRGIISQTDVVLNHGIEWFMRLQPTRSVIKAPPLTGDHRLTLADAAERMKECDTHAIVLKDDQGSLGILTERDVVRCIAERCANVPASDMASKPLATVDADTSLFHARAIMSERGFRHIGVTEEGALIGLVSFADILSSIEHSYVEELEQALAAREVALQASEQRYRALVESSPDAILVVREGSILYINPAGVRLFGARDEDLVVDRLLSDFLGDTDARGETKSRFLRSTPGEDPAPDVLIRADGSTIDVEISAMEIRYNDAAALQVVIRNVSHRKKLEDELRRLATTDQLTGIHNRLHFESHVDQAMREKQRFGTPVSLVMLDIDNFKQVNDSYGHDAGDQVLRRFVEAVRMMVRETDMLARWGGEEFMILASGTDLAGAERLAEKVRAGLAETPLLDSGEPLTASFGVAEHRSGEVRDSLIKRVDDALYRAKHGGRNRVRIAGRAAD